ncbi:MAG: Xaa-Pro peptidase family protein [Chloroflexi bacterium]|nr:Xaa-Pro peptidase family protein [Chloroflexota bacterium]
MAAELDSDRARATYARQRIEVALEGSPFEAIVAISPENTRYASGVWVATQQTLRDRLALVVWPKSGQPTLIVCNIEEGYCRSQSWISDIRAYAEHLQSPIALLAQVLREKRLDRSRIGMETGYLSARFWNELIQMLPNAVFEPAEPIFDQARMIKSPEEIRRLAEGSLVTEQALLATYLCTRPGETERSLAQRLTANLLLMGADSVPFLHIPAGPNTGFPHPPATDYQVKEGDLVKTDFGGSFDGYVSDRARTMVVGKPSPEQVSLYACLVEIHNETLQAANPGVPASEIFRVARAGYRRLKVPFDPPHAGHGLGLSVHEPPMLSPAFLTELVPGMVLAIETRVRIPGEYGMHIEDLVEITADGHRVHTRNFPYESLLAV